MSMNVFFQAFTHEDFEAMKGDSSVIDEWVGEQERCVFSTDIGNAWDVLNKLLSGAGFRSSLFVDDALSNGCEMVSEELVKEHSASLAAYDTSGLIEGLKHLKNDAYHLAVYQEDTGELLEEFEKLVTFYRSAADQGLAVVHYAA